MHKERLEETVASGIAAYYKDQPVKKKHAEAFGATTQRVYVRLVNDTCTLSIDTSGEPLYKRWPGKIVGAAPLRENFAAAMIHQLQALWPKEGERLLVVDPLCGSDTLLAEALSYHHTHGPRDYAFCSFPSLALIRQRVVKIAGQALTTAGLGDVTAWGFDRDAGCVTAVNSNFGPLGVHAELHDAFKTLPTRLSTAREAFDRVLLLTNLPYGKRVALGEPGQGDAAYTRLLSTLQAQWTPTHWGLIVPAALRRLGKWQTSLRFKNGGIDVRFLRK